MKKLIIFCCLAGFMSCQKECPENTDASSRLLVSVSENGRLVSGFQYDSLNRIVQLNRYINDSLYYSEAYQYDQKNRISQRLYSGFIETYEYNRDGSLKSTLLIYPASGKEWKTEYQYSRGKISKGITFYNGEKRGYVEFKYDSNGNTIERSEYLPMDGQEDFLDSQFKLTYDDHINPLKNLHIYPADLVQKNNPVYSYHYLSIMSSPPREYHSTYEYDDEGYPIKETRGSMVFTYHYQDKVN